MRRLPATSLLQTMLPLLIVGLLATSCAMYGPPHNIKMAVSASFDKYRLRRVCILPFASDPASQQLPVAAILAESLQKLQGLKIIVCPQYGQGRTGEALSKSIPLSAAFLLHLSQSSQADGVIRGEIVCYSLLPLSIGITFDLISTYDGTVLWSVNGTWGDDQFYSLRELTPTEAQQNLSPTLLVTRGCDAIVAMLADRNK